MRRKVRMAWAGVRYPLLASTHNEIFGPTVSRIRRTISTSRSGSTPTFILMVPETASQPRLVEQAALSIGEHGPQPADHLGGQARREHRHIAFKIAANEVGPPAQAACLRLR